LKLLDISGNSYIEIIADQERAILYIGDKVYPGKKCGIIIAKAPRSACSSKLLDGLAKRDTPGKH
jgi:hypothetical protein